MSYSQINMVKDLDNQKVKMKDEVTDLFDKKKMFKSFLTVFDEYDFDKWNGLSKKDQMELINKALPGMNEILSNFISAKLKTFKNIGNKRLETKKANDEL